MNSPRMKLIAANKNWLGMERAAEVAILSAHYRRKQTLEEIEEKYHKIGKEIEEEMLSKYPSVETIKAKTSKREELKEMLARYGIKVKSKMSTAIVSRYEAARQARLDAIQKNQSQNVK